MWWIVLLSSAGLIGMGVWLLLREYLASRVPGEPLTADTASRVSARQPAAVLTAQKPQAAVPNERPTGASVEPLRAALSPSRLPAVETHWPRLKPEIDMAIAAVNESLAPLAVMIAKPGEPTWSLHNRGFGDYRRVRVGGESVAWLRLELAADLIISAHLRTHEPRHDMMNRVSSVDRPLTASRIAPALAECVAALAAASPRLMPVVAQSLTQSLTQSLVVAPIVAPDIMPADPWLAPAAAPPPPPPARERGPVWPQWLSRPTPVATLPTAAVSNRPRPLSTPATTLIDTAVTLVNSAFAEAGARLIPAGEAVRRDPVGPESRALSIDVAGHSVGLMLIEPVSNRIEIAVGVADLTNFDAARRRSHDLAGLTVHPLAETIATCAWPAIAAAKAGA